MVSPRLCWGAREQGSRGEFSSTPQHRGGGYGGCKNKQAGGLSAGPPGDRIEKGWVGDRMSGYFCRERERDCSRVLNKGFAKTCRGGTECTWQEQGRGNTRVESLWSSNTCLIRHAPPAITGGLGADIMLQSEAERARTPANRRHGSRLCWRFWIFPSLL